MICYIINYPKLLQNWIEPFHFFIVQYPNVIWVFCFREFCLDKFFQNFISSFMISFGFLYVINLYHTGTTPIPNRYHTVTRQIDNIPRFSKLTASMSFAKIAWFDEYFNLWNRNIKTPIPTKIDQNIPNPSQPDIYGFTTCFKYIRLRVVPYAIRVRHDAAMCDTDPKILWTPYARSQTHVNGNRNKTRWTSSIEPIPFRPISSINFITQYIPDFGYFNPNRAY